MPSARFTHEVHTAASPETAWRVLQEPETWGSLGGVTDIRDAKYADDGDLLSYSFSAMAAAKSYDGRATTVVSEAPQTMAIKIASIEMTGRIAINLEAVETGTKGTVSLTLEPKGFLSSMFFTAIKVAVGTGFPQQAEALAERFTE